MFNFTRDSGIYQKTGNELWLILLYRPLLKRGKVMCLWRTYFIIFFFPCWTITLTLLIPSYLQFFHVFLQLSDSPTSHFLHSGSPNHSVHTRCQFSMTLLLLHSHLYQIMKTITFPHKSELIRSNTDNSSKMFSELVTELNRISGNQLRRPKTDKKLRQWCKQGDIWNNLQPTRTNDIHWLLLYMG